MALLFWLALALIIYVYAGYPLVLAVWARLRPKPWCRSDDAWPPVSIVLAARDEASRLAGRLDNLFALDYPADRLEIVIVSDGSTDRTAAVAAPYMGVPGRPRVRLLEQPADGKAAALNAGVAAACHDILVFADARQRFAHDAVKRLVANFADPHVGGVSGELVLDCEVGATSSSVANEVGTYWRYEKWLRARETAVDSMLGATGAIYALRRSAWRPLPPGTILDDVLAPMRAVLDGWRIVFDGSARAFDETPRNAAAEVRRKTRTLAGNWQLLAREPRVLVPGLNRTWFQYWSHKVGRLLVPFALAALFVSSLALAGRSALYLLAVALQVIFFALAWYGARLERRGADRQTRVERRRRKAVNA
jgi:cellulose synthase/poly-beta-1,6-N-acetylglucosamine synthase-like glycosyltransferase